MKGYTYPILHNFAASLRNFETSYQTRLAVFSKPWAKVNVKKWLTVERRNEGRVVISINRTRNVLDMPHSAQPAESTKLSPREASGYAL